MKEKKNVINYTAGMMRHKLMEDMSQQAKADKIAGEAMDALEDSDWVEALGKCAECMACSDDITQRYAMIGVMCIAKHALVHDDDLTAMDYVDFVCGNGDFPDPTKTIGLISGPKC